MRVAAVTVGAVPLRIDDVVAVARGNTRVELAPAALAAAGLEPVAFVEKEGLALINGTDGMLGQSCLAIADLRALAKAVDVTAATGSWTAIPT